jgi:catechol 2,3-dioxygenase
MEATQSTLIDSIANVELRVRDIEEALGFYRDIAGLQVVDKDAEQATLSAPGGPVVLVLRSTGVDSPARRDATGLYHTAIRYPDRGALANALARLVSAGYRIGASDHGVSEALYIDDPDGNGVELYRDRPRDQWPPPNTQYRTPMFNAPLDLDGLLEDAGKDAPDGAAPGTDIGHVHLQVSDLESTRAFLVDVLGLDLMAEFPGQAGFYSSNDYHHHLGANTWHSRHRSAAPKNHAGLERIVFNVSPGELDKARLRLTQTGHAVSGSDEELIVADPDGIALHFVATSGA